MKNVKNDLCKAIISHSTNAVDLLNQFITGGGKVNDTCQGYPLINLAVKYHNEDILNVLLENGVNLNVSDYHLYTPLHLAVMNHDLHCLKKLLNYGAAPNVWDEHGETPLIIAVAMGDFPSIKVLLEAEASANTQNERGESAVEMAVISNRLDILSILITHHGGECSLNKEGMHPVALAARLGRAEALKMLLADSSAHFIDLLDDHDMTPLAFAVQHNWTHIVSLLLPYRCNVNVQDIGGFTPLHSAVINENLTIANLLLSAGADTKARTIVGYSPLDLAIAHNNEDMVRMMIDYGAPVNSRLSPPIIAAINQKSFPIVKLLLRGGAKTDVSDKDGNTVLGLAIKSGDAALVRMLLDYDVNFHQTTQGLQPLELAASLNNLEIMALLNLEEGDIHDQPIEIMTSPNLDTSDEWGF